MSIPGTGTDRRFGVAEIRLGLLGREVLRVTNDRLLAKRVITDFGKRRSGVVSIVPTNRRGKYRLCWYNSSVETLGTAVQQFAAQNLTLYLISLEAIDREARQVFEEPEALENTKESGKTKEVVTQ